MRKGTEREGKENLQSCFRFLIGKACKVHTQRFGYKNKSCWQHKYVCHKASVYIYLSILIIFHILISFLLMKKLN